MVHNAALLQTVESHKENKFNQLEIFQMIKEKHFLCVIMM